ncbi:cysteine hydrolase family protein [Pseudomonas fluorescens]|uniref:Peroxyureidoacrylate/ureidoacrylate amidohydrolase RutB n=1 Tax=Pseudomonas fluorescens TaxID=294 RepID=A0A5E7CFG3_PSEFL|nr:cysteine hydrolase family protein [Pseudomonas fluorescens]VVN94433.1 Peroxyureidoacrylate/ureidoacrylate amidohydrolase RutB [Pseudomonas fluorescens]
MELKANAALILIDQQKGIHHPKLGRRNNPHAEDRIAELLGHWRDTARPVIHVQHMSRLPDSVFWPRQSGVEFQQRFVPLPGEQVIQKQVPDAFCATTLEVGLREAGIEQLIIVGVATHNSVESTARTAGNLGFQTWVVEDACYTFDKADYFGNAHTAEAVHAMSLGNLNGEYATVVDTAQILKEG